MSFKRTATGCRKRALCRAWFARLHGRKFADMNAFDCAEHPEECGGRILASVRRSFAQPPRAFTCQRQSGVPRPPRRSAKPQRAICGTCVPVEAALRKAASERHAVIALNT